MTEATVQAPEGWRAVPLADLASFRTGPFGSTFHKSDYQSGGVPLINPSHIIDGEIVPDERVAVAPDLASRLSVFALRENDIVIGRRGEMGRCAVVRSHTAGFLCGTGSMIVRPRPGVSPELLQAFLASPKVVAKIEENSVGTTMINLNQGTLSSLEILLPDNDHGQQAIAAALSDADGVVAGLERVIAKKRLIKQGAMQDLLTARRRLTGFSGVWQSRPLSSVSSFITKGATPTTYGFGWEAHGILFLRSECVSSRGLDLSQSMFISEEAHRATKRSEVTSGDILITITGNVGRVIRLPNDFGQANINQHIARVRVNSGAAIPDFVFHQLSRPEYLRHFNSIVTGQAYPQISLQQVREAEVHFPEIDEQLAIAEFLNDMDAEIQTLETRLTKARAVKEWMMQNLLTGRVRLV
ncbi:MAG: restriction endonuclease subunit S [Rhodobacteraceae bacterium]|nr:restriction endonuclease subunit S [Paracoccaceae bacterium]